MGNELVSFCTRSKLVIANALFEQQKRRIYTLKSPGDRYRNQIDYILINKRFRSNIKQIKTYPGADIGSNHNPLVMKIKIKLKKLEKKKQNPQLELNRLKEDHYREQYNISVNNKYNALVTEEIPQRKETEIDKKWNVIRDSMNAAAGEVLPKKRKEAKQAWMTEEILDKMKERKPRTKIQRYKRLKQDIDTECTAAKENFWNQKCAEIENLEATQRHKEMHKKIKEITNERQKPKGSKCIRDKEGRMLFEEEQVKKRWEKYVGELYGTERGEKPITEENAD